jgi:hypothetical protein
MRMQRSPAMSDHHPGDADDEDAGLADAASSHGSDLDPRVGEDEEDQPTQTEGADEAGP